MRHLPFATISFLLVIVGVLALTINMNTINHASTSVTIIQHENLESILSNSQEKRMSIQYTIEADSEPTINQTTIIQVLQPNDEQSMP